METYIHATTTTTTKNKLDRADKRRVNVNNSLCSHGIVVSSPTAFDGVNHGVCVLMNALLISCEQQPCSR